MTGDDGRTAGSGSRRARLWLIIAVPSVGWAVWSLFHRDPPLTFPDPGTLAVAFLAAAALNVALIAAWIVLFDTDVDRHVLITSFTVSNLARYSPVGGVAQVASQLDIARQSTVSTIAVAERVAINKLTMVAAGCVWSGIGAFVLTDVPAAIRLILLLATAGVAVVDPRVLRFALRIVHRFVPSWAEASDPPPAGRLVISTLWSVVGLALYSGGQVALARAMGAELPLIPGIAGFSIAWVAGFVVIPIPSGLGVREAVSALVISGPTAPIVAASLMFRLVQLVNDLIVAGVAAAVISISRSRQRN